MTKTLSKKTYKITAKQRLRVKLRKHLKRKLKRKRPQDVNVFCLPGHELLEIIEVYDKLGIPRDNIFGVERSADAYREIKGRGFSNIANISVDGFCSVCNMQFDVISLDYCGTFKDDVDITLSHIATKKLLAPDGVMFLEFLGAREPKWLTDDLFPEGRDLTAYDKKVEQMVESMDVQLHSALDWMNFCSSLMRLRYHRDSDWRLPVFMHYIEHFLANPTGSYFDFQKNMWQQPLELMGHMEKECSGYFVKRAFPYKYISDSGSPMIAYVIDVAGYRLQSAHVLDLLACGTAAMLTDNKLSMIKTPYVQGLDRYRMLYPLTVL